MCIVDVDSTFTTFEHMSPVKFGFLTLKTKLSLNELGSGSFGGWNGVMVSMQETKFESFLM